MKKILLFILILVLIPLKSPAEKNIADSDRRNSVVLAVEKVSPAVVNINTEEVIKEKNPFSDFGLGDRFFQEYFRDFYPPENYTRQSLGSGVIIDSKGYILTNEHVISRATKIRVTMIDKREYEATLVGADVRSDLAVIKIDSKEELPFAKTGHSDDLMIGETIIAIGNPFGLSHTVTTGVISALNRSIKGEKDRIYNDFIQLDASINPGNSGGPLLNINGEIIGINTAIYQRGEGIGFAIPIDKANRIVNSLLKYGEVPETWTGIIVQDLTRSLRTYFKFEEKGGVLISKIFKNSPADKGGLKEGDIIISIDDKPIIKMDDYQDRIYGFLPSEKFSLMVFRAGEKKKTTLIPEKITSELADEIVFDWLGVKVTDLTRKLLREFNIYTDKGVVITKIDSRSALGRIGLQMGDVIKQINDLTVNNVKDFQKGIIAARKYSSILFLVQRGRYGYYVTVEP